MKTSSAVTAGHRGLEDSRIYKLALTGLFAALSYVVFTFCQINITLPGGDATSIHLGNAVCVLGALILGGFYGGLGGALGMTIGDLFDPIYVVYAPKTFLLKLCIGLITGLVAHKIGRINESSDKRHVFRFVVAASVCGLLFNVIFDPLVGYFLQAGDSGANRQRIWCWHGTLPPPPSMR